MSYKYKRSVFWFRQDLRLEDNVGWHHACAESDAVLAIFVFDTNVLGKFDSGLARIGFLKEAVLDLQQQLRNVGGDLVILYGDPCVEIAKVLKEKNIESLWSNYSYGVGATTRDRDMRIWCDDHAVAREQRHDYVIVPPACIDQRKVFTPFFRLWKKYLEINPVQCFPLCSPVQWIHYEQDSSWEENVDTGPNMYRTLDSWKQVFEKSFENYGTTRNIPGVEGTTKLSPYLRFGLVSPRKIYQYFIQQDNEGAEIVISELAWREFRQHISHYFPDSLEHGFQAKRQYIQRENNEEWFEAWKEGRTGYPIVDAGMRQLKQENRMHNRVRMVVASFLTKDLLIDRRRGEQHFADYLIDYDRNINIGNRQWSASVGADPKPLRIFNPILQSKRFDPEGKYIFKYLPELEGQPLKAIHDPIKYGGYLNYHTPIVDHYVRSKKAKERYNASKAYHESQL